MNLIRITAVTVTIGASLAVAILQAGRASRIESENQTLRESRDHATVARAFHNKPPGFGGITDSPIDKESEDARLARLNEEADESIRQQREASEIEMEKNPPFNLVQPDGITLTSEAAKKAGLDARQLKAVNGILEKTMAESSADFAERAGIVDAESRATEGVTVYFVPARRDRGKEIRDRLESALDREVGEEKRKILTRNLNENDFIAEFGAQDIRLEFSAKGKTYQFAYLNPLNGEPSTFGDHPLAEFGKQFGNSFELPKNVEAGR